MRKNSTSSRVKVLLVDDCLFLRTAVAGLLGVDAEIVVVGQAGDGAEGLRLTLELCPDVVVTDLEMPVMDGAEFVTRLLQRCHISVIVFSAVRRDSPLAVRALKAGALAHIAKPLAVADVALQQQVLRRQILSAPRRRAV